MRLVNLTKARAPWSWGRMHDIFFAHSFGKKGARSNPVANYERKREKNSERKIDRNWKRNKKRLDPKLVKEGKRDSIRRM